MTLITSDSVMLESALCMVSKYYRLFNNLSAIVHPLS